MRLFIAEKPELARAIARAIDGSESKGDGYIQKGDNIVSWAYGHILALKDPDEYNERYKKWSLQDLPLDVKYIQKPIESEHTKKQLKILQNLISKNEVNEIVHCGDADEEGQILVDEILYYARTNKPVKRMLINDISPKAIKKELSNLKDNKDFRLISECGFARSYADYLVGMNMTRAYTTQNPILAKNGVLSVGRVQTPILALIYNREVENESFKSLNYFTLEAIFQEIPSVLFSLDSEEKIQDRQAIENLANSLKSKPFILKIKKESKSEQPPLAYNLLNLQSDASKLFGFSAKKTLDITQKLRESHEAITYNRSDCEYIPESIFEDRHDILNSIKHNFGDRFNYGLLDMDTKTRAFDDSKLSAHYGIIPTEKKLDLGKLSNDERVIYELITQRFLLQFAKKREYDSFTLKAISDEASFSKTLNFTTKLGFKEFIGKQADDKEEEADADSDSNLKSIICNLQDNQNVNIQDFKITQRTTKPPAKYNVTTLLKDLNQVSKYVKDEKIKKLLRERDKDKKGESGGIGTPATRADTIERLVSRGFITISQDKKQSIAVTPKGKEFIKILSPIFTSLDMSALWFEMQKSIMAGKMTKEQFLAEVQKGINEEIAKIKEKGVNMSGEGAIKCPSCDNGILIRKKGKYGFFWGCTNYQVGCQAIFNDYNGKPDFENKTKKGASGQTTEYSCPVCKKGKLVRRESSKQKGTFWYGCSDFRDGCKYMCSEKNGKPDIKEG